MLAGLVFILGLILVLLEVFVLPGIGAAGITGVLLMLVSLGLVTFGGNEVPQTAAEWFLIGKKMAWYLGGMIVSVGLALLIARYLPNIPYANRLKKRSETWSSSYHVFSVEWTPAAYVFRVDGREFWRETEIVSQSPEYLLLSMLTSDYELEKLTSRTMGQRARVDWVRVWAR